MKSHYTGTLFASVLMCAAVLGSEAASAEGCFWMSNKPGNPWVAAPQGKVSKEQCFNLDSCDGGKGQSSGGCYKWATSAKAHRQPWFYSRLSNQFRGNDMCLDVFNGGAKNNMTHLTKCADLSGQYWALSGAANEGWYRLTTMFRGKEMCLDIHNGGNSNNHPHLTKCANFSGQLWKLKGPDAGGWHRLTTQFRGEDMCLDIFNGGAQNNQPHLTKCANFSGQLWKLSRTNKRVK